MLLSRPRLIFLPLFLALLTLLLLSPPTAAWEQIDMDIFDLVEQVNRFHGGKKTSFYSILHVEQDATVPEITRAHRKLSLSMHPDKNPSPEAKDRFNMLGAVTRTLKNPETRARYDFYLKNGVPVRHGATYLYSRYRPPLSHVLLFLGFFISAVQYLLAHVDRWRRKSLWIEAKEEEDKANARLRRSSRKQTKAAEETEEIPDFPYPRVQDMFLFAFPLFLVRHLVLRPLHSLLPKDTTTQDVGPETEEEYARPEGGNETLTSGPRRRGPRPSKRR